MTVVEQLALMRAGRAAYRADLPSSMCPYSLVGAYAEQVQAVVWLRGYVLARRLDEERAGQGVS